MKRFPILLFAFVSLLFFVSSCRPSYDLERSTHQEGTVIFTRSVKYTMFFGTYSKRDLVEVTHEQVRRNAAGYLEVTIGIRYRGPVSWTDWYRVAPKTMSLNARCRFMESKNAPDLYTTNTQTITMRLGEIYTFRATCPVKNATDYQLVLSE